jgi:serine-type D-Ala-D-Ala carboxypeptidase (penicillin-binding protein 5/6)
VKRTLLVAAAALALAAPSSAAPPQVTARAWLVQNAATGETLLGHDARARVPIASITKLMTVLVALEHARLDDLVTVQARAASIGESTINLHAGERIAVRDLVEAALIQSANDAAWALAVHVGDGSVTSFVALMNDKARQLGLADTHFVRPDGLDAPRHVSSARDVTKLARIAMNKPAIRAIVRQRNGDAAGRPLHTWNDLLGSFPGLIGVKTGHTRGAGWSQVAAARGRGLTIYATILGSPGRSQRNSDLAELLAWGLAQYRVVDLIGTERVYARVLTAYDRPAVRLVADGPLVRVVRVGRPLVERVVAPAVVPLPVAKGAQLGSVEVWEGDTLLGRRALVAAAAVDKPDLAGRVRWYAGRALRNAWGMLT